MGSRENEDKLGHDDTLLEGSVEKDRKIEDRKKHVEM